MMKEHHKKITIWTMLRRVVPQIALASPGLFALYTTLYVLEGIIVAVSVFFMQRLFESATSLATGKCELKATMLALAFVLGIKLLEQIINGIDNYIAEIYFMRAYRSMVYEINLKMGRLDPVDFENSDTLDHINKCYDGVPASIRFVNRIIDILVFYIPYFLSMAIYLFWLKPILVISLVLVFVPVVISNTISIKYFSNLEDVSAPLRRKAKYYEECIVSRQYAKETRILGACPYFLKLLKESLVTMNNLKWKTEIKSNLLKLGTKLISLSGYMGIIWLLFRALMSKEISVGAFAAVFASVGSMFNLMEEVVCKRLVDCVNNFGKVQNYLSFLDLPERQGQKLRSEDLKMKNHGMNDEDEKLDHGDIILEGVTFAYPLSDKNAVEDINLQIKRGETIAVVGENGSGKSTLVKLITGLYLPQKGLVIHNNKATKDLSSRVLFKGTSAVFQKINKYQLTLRENIIISEMDRKNIRDYGVNKALEDGGVELNQEVFPQGQDTILSREFDGIDLSGGQWQKVAIARGLYRDHELIILDEPTAAIDPIEETRVYERFAEISKGKTSVIVTHRLGSVKFADRIVVMKEGKIEGVGTHDMLIETCPAYKAMWDSQAQYYVDNKDKVV